MLKEKLVEYKHNGDLLEGFFAYDDNVEGERPSILISHAWAGRDEFVSEKARKLAGIGYAAFALDLYGKGVLGGDPGENNKLMTPFREDRDFLQKRMTISLNKMNEQSEVDVNKVVAIGFCFGGLCVLDLARIGTDIKGVVSFHGLLDPPPNTSGKEIKAKVLVLHGNDDPMVPCNKVVGLEDELTAARADWQLHVYGNTMHAFSNPNANNPDLGTVYNERSDKRSWQAFLGFLDEVFQ